MNLEQLAKDMFSTDRKHMEQMIFASIFIHQNKMQTACDKLDSEITMKQWLLLAVVSTFDTPMSLSQIGEIMGCSRQNVKKLANSLQKKGYIKYESDNRSTFILVEDKMKEYIAKVGDIQENVLKILFEDFSNEEIKQYFNLVTKLYSSIEKVENYAHEIKSERK